MKLSDLPEPAFSALDEASEKYIQQALLTEAFLTASFLLFGLGMKSTALALIAKIEEARQ